MKSLLFSTCMLSIAACNAQQIPSAAVQIKTAVLAAPEEKREGAMIYGYSDKGEFTVLKKGSNDLICLADDPEKKGFNVSCYHKDLEGFMARGRALQKEGKSQTDIFNMREAEVKSGKLVMPKQPSSLFVYTTAEEKYDRSTGDIQDGYLRYVIYIPYATPESTGLPLKPDAPGMPWIMDPGTHRAHIMINPPQKN
jgi:hypothetical protein